MPVVAVHPGQQSIGALVGAVRSARERPSLVTRLSYEEVRSKDLVATWVRMTSEPDSARLCIQRVRLRRMRALMSEVPHASSEFSTSGLLPSRCRRRPNPGPERGLTCPRTCINALR